MDDIIELNYANLVCNSVNSEHNIQIPKRSTFPKKYIKILTDYVFSIFTCRKMQEKQQFSLNPFELTNYVNLQIISFDCYKKLTNTFI